MMNGGEDISTILAKENYSFKNGGWLLNDFDVISREWGLGSVILSTVPIAIDVYTDIPRGAH